MQHDFIPDIQDSWDPERQQLTEPICRAEAHGGFTVYGVYRIRGHSHLICGGPDQEKYASRDWWGIPWHASYFDVDPRTVTPIPGRINLIYERGYYL